MKIISSDEWHKLINSKFYKKGGIVFSSSGSTGISKSLIYPKSTIKKANNRLKELMKLTPLKSNSKIVILWGYGLFPPAYYYTQTLSQLGHVVYPLGSGKNLNSDVKVRELFHILPDVIIGMPSYILKICIMLKNQNYLDDIKSNLKFVVTGGELLTNQLRKEIECLLNIKVYDSYGMLQVPMIAGECCCGKLHLSKDYKAEILTDGNEIKKNGEGTLLLSSNKIFSNFKMNRFKTSDIVYLDGGKCKCGYRTKTIKILGRDCNIQKVKGQLVNFDMLLQYLAENNFEDNFYIEIIKNPTDNVVFHVSDNINVDDFKKSVDYMISFNYEIIIEKNFSYIETNTGKVKKIILID